MDIKNEEVRQLAAPEFLLPFPGAIFFGQNHYSWGQSEKCGQDVRLSFSETMAKFLDKDSVKSAFELPVYRTDGNALVIRP